MTRRNRTRRRRAPGLRRALFLLGPLALVLLAAPVAAQRAPAGTANLFGRVTDEAGAPLSGVLVAVLLTEAPTPVRTVLTDGAGAYQLVGLAPRRYRVRAGRLGYRADEWELALAAGERRRLDLTLRTDTVLVEGVVVEGRRAVDRERARFETEPGITARVVGGEQLKVLPGLAEADVLRAVELLPGVVSTSDFSSAFHVRGGSADQNLILLDGVPIFNPFHLGGLFGVFNADAIASAELLAGGFGAEYGGRVSSVLNVESNAEAADGLEVMGGVSLLATRVLVRSELPDRLGRALGGERGSWLVSARRSYFDQLFRPVFTFPYHLTDLQANATIETRGGGRLRFTAYGGSDVLDLSDFSPPGADAEESFLRVRWNWGNRVAGLGWTQPLGEAWTADARLGYSGFEDALGFTDFDDVRFGSRIRQLTLRTDLRRAFAEASTFKLGGSLEHLGYRNNAEAGGTQFFGGEGAGVLAATYASVLWNPDPRWVVEPGLRLDAWLPRGGARVLLAPRFAAKRFLGEERDAAVKLSLGRYTQFLHSLRDEEFPISNDTWILAGEDVPPVVSDQAQVGLDRFWESWSLSTELYYRTFRGVTEFNLVDDPNDPGDDLLVGDGRSYGLDLLLRRTRGRLTGWAAASLLRAERTLPDPAAAGWEDLPQTVTFPPIFDRRFDFDLIVQYLLPRDVEFGARWNYGSPIPYTRPVSQHLAWRHNLPRGRFEPARRQGPGELPLVVVLGERNAERYPAYHRLDLTLRRTFRPRWGSYTPYLQVLNVYNQRNVLFYFYNYDRLPATRSGISMFPVLPSIGIEATFR
jgi:hypothetical protein